MTDFGEVRFVNVYGRAAQGFRAPSIQGRIMFCADFEGGTNPATNCVTTADTESNLSFEIGVKSDLSDIFRVNATLYYYDYSDYQTFVAIPPGATSPNPQVGNSDATAMGGEVELFITPNDNLDILLGFAFMDTEVELVEAGAVPIEDAELPNAPGTSANYLFRYAWPMSSNEIAFQFDGAYYGDQFLEVTNGPGTEQESYNVSNVRLTYSTDRFAVSVWSKNVFDELYKAYSLDLGLLGATSYYAPPRTSGVTLEAFF